MADRLGQSRLESRFHGTGARSASSSLGLQITSIGRSARRKSSGSKATIPPLTQNAVSGPSLGCRLDATGDAWGLLAGAATAWR
jgi:hypothetical protein